MTVMTVFGEKLKSPAFLTLTLTSLRVIAADFFALAAWAVACLGARAFGFGPFSPLLTLSALSSAATFTLAAPLSFLSASTACFAATQASPKVDSASPVVSSGNFLDWAHPSNRKTK